MLKNQKGVTLTVLVVTIIVLGILANITISTTTDLMHDSKIKTYITNMSMVKAKAETIYEKYEFENDTSDSTNGLGTGDDNIGEKVDVSELGKYSIESDGTSDNYWYKWTETTLSNNGFSPEMLKSSGECFYVNYRSGEIVYSKGFKGTGTKTIYSLTEMKNYNN